MWVFFFIAHFPILPQHSQEKTLTALQCSRRGGLLTCHVHVFHLFIFLTRRQRLILPCCKAHGVLEATQGWNSSNDMLHLRKDRFTTLSAVPALSKWKIDYVMREDWCFMIITQRACFTFQEYLTSSNNL